MSALDGSEGLMDKNDAEERKEAHPRVKIPKTLRRLKQEESPEEMRLFRV